jgi:chaperonin GroES
MATIPDDTYDPGAAAAAVTASMAEASAPSPQEKLMTLAQSTANLAEAMDEQALTELGAKVVEDYEKDKASRKEWEDMASEMLAAASQDKPAEAKDTPWKSASNVNIPLLTIAALQWNARMYPAAIKGDEAILCKVVGQDNGVSMKGPDGHPMVMMNGQPVPAMVGFQAQQAAMAQQPQVGPDGQPVPPQAPPPPQIAWSIPPGAKASRARRVSEYLNTTIFYRMEAWEADTDALMTQLPIVGCAFRKVWWTKGAQSAFVPALRLIVNENVRSLDTAPRITEEMPERYPFEIACKQREGLYRQCDLGISEDEEDKPRLLLEQYRYADLDEDGYDEPYIVTVDKESREVLRVEANFSPRDIEWGPDGKPVKINAGKFYVKYGFFPHPQGKFYDIGLGHLLKHIGAGANTLLNQLIDAGSAAVAGGGFIASGLRLQGRAGRNVIRFGPGEYKTVEASADDLRKAIYERTLPQVSPVSFQVLDFIMGFAREIAGIKDILTGQAAPTAPVGTVLAQIEQGLQVFNATAKRFFRAAREEYELLFEKTGRYGDEATAKDYLNVLDDPQANFAQDFNADDIDIRPVSDPSAVTRMQKMAKAQYLQSQAELIAQVGGDMRELVRRSLEAADIEDIDKLLPPPQPPPPNPVEEMQVVALQAKANKDNAHADKATAEAQAVGLTAQGKAAEHVAGADKKNAEAVATTIGAQAEKYGLEHQTMADGMKAAKL